MCGLKVGGHILSIPSPSQLVAPKQLLIQLSNLFLVIALHGSGAAAGTAPSFYLVSPFLITSSQIFLRHKSLHKYLQPEKALFNIY